MRKILTTALYFFVIFTIYATEIQIDLSVTEEILFNTSKSDTPHYMSANQWGNMGEKNVQAISIIDYRHQINNVNDYFSFEWGITAGFNINESSKLLLNQFYGQINFKALTLYVGKKKQTVGSNPEELSSGSMVVSSNATPIPKINLGFFEYVTVPYTWDILQIKGNIAHGWFEGERKQDGVLLHEKSLYLRFNTKTGLYPYVGFVHEAMWGGDGLMSVTWTNFIKTFFASNGGNDSLSTEQINALGNHLGIWDFGISGYYKSIDFQVYYEHYFEDFSGINFSNGLDGLWGLTLQPKNIKFINRFLFEYLKTDDQSSSKDEVDSYYFNSVYRSGWTNLYDIIGNSFITSRGTGDTLSIADNRMKVIHMGINGPISDVLDYTIQMAYARYYDAYHGSSEYESGDYMVYLYGQMVWDNFIREDLTLKTAMAYDFGSADNIFGISFALTWNL